MENSYCGFCFNARVWSPETEDDFLYPITDENDLSWHGIRDRGSVSDKRSIMIRSGGGKPLCIEFSEWFDKGNRWITSAEYYPRYCPECGRKLDEYDRSKTNE